MFVMSPGRMLNATIFCLAALAATAAPQLVKAQKAMPLEHLQKADGDHEADETDFVRQRDEWFWKQRLFPSGTIPANAHHLALEHREQMRAAWQARLTPKGLRAKPAASLATVPWTFDGPLGLVISSGGEPYSARVPSLAVDPNNPGTLYIGTAGGGVWKTTDNGTSWTPLTDDQPSLSIGAVAVDPNNSNNIYAGTGEADFSGDSWYGEGMLESTDAGATWKQVIAPFSNGYTGPDFSQIAVQPGNSSVVLAASSFGLFRSADQGQTWTSVITGDATAVLFDTKTSTVAYASVPDQVYKSTDSGSTWTAMTTGFPTSSMIRIALTENSAGTTLFASIALGTDTAPGLIYKTPVSTVNWTALTAPGDCCDWYRNGIAVDPANSNVIYVAGLDGDFSLDGGNTWTSLGYNSGANNSWADKHWFAFNPSGSEAYIGSDGGVFGVTSPATATPAVASLNQPIGTMTFYPGMALPAANTTSTLTLVGAQDHGLDAYNGGVWGYGDYNFCGDGMSTYVDKDGIMAYAQCRGGSANWINNATGGQNPSSWASAQSGINTSDAQNWVTPLTGDPEVDATVYTGTYRVYQTTNSATSWTAISGDLTTGSGYGNLVTIAVAPSNSNYVYAGSSDGMFSMTKNATAGASAVWTSTAFTPQSYITKIVVAPDSPTDVFVTVSGFGTGHVFHSTDGVNFTDISGNLPDTPTNGIAVDPDVANLYYLATDTGAFFTQDGGTTWAPLGTGLPNVVVQDIGIATGRIVRVVTHGRGAWDLQLPGGVSQNVLGVSTNPSTYGQAVTFTATVSSATPGTPTGSVSFLSGSTVLGSTSLNGSAVASYTTSSLSVGSHSITASYSGDGTFLPSVSTVTTQVVNKAGTSTSVKSSAGTTNFDQSITFTATAVSATSGTPTGSVNFMDGSSSLGSGTLNGSGVATLAVSTLTAGSHSITAGYGGDSNFTSSTSSALSQTVADFKLSAATLSPSSISAGQTATAQITVASLTGFSSAVSLTCAVTPVQAEGPTCSFSSTPVTPTGSGATSTLTVSTTGPTAGLAVPFGHQRGAWWAVVLLAPALLLGTVAASSRRKNLLGYWVICVVAAGCLMQAGCGSKSSSTGGGNNGTPAGAYTVTITAAAGVTQHTTSASVTVQ